MLSLHLSRLDRIGKAQRDVPKWLRAAKVRAWGTPRLADESRPNTLLLRGPARSHDMAGPGMVPQANLERPGVASGAKAVFVAAVILNYDLIVALPVSHDISKRDREVFAGFKVADEPLRRRCSRNRVFRRAEANRYQENR